MKNIRIFIRKCLFFGGQVFSIFEQACFRNETCCGYSLEEPCPDASNEYPQHVFMDD